MLFGHITCNGERFASTIAPVEFTYFFPSFLLCFAISRVRAVMLIGLGRFFNSASLYCENSTFFDTILPIKAKIAFKFIKNPMKRNFASQEMKTK